MSREIRDGWQPWRFLFCDAAYSQNTIGDLVIVVILIINMVITSRTESNAGANSSQLQVQRREQGVPDTCHAAGQWLRPGVRTGMIQTSR